MISSVVAHYNEQGSKLINLDVKFNAVVNTALYYSLAIRHMLCHVWLKLLFHTTIMFIYRKDL